MLYLNDVVMANKHVSILVHVCDIDISVHIHLQPSTGAEGDKVSSTPGHL